MSIDNVIQRINLVVSSFEKAGATYRGIGTSGDIIRFDIPHGTRYDDKDVLRDAAYACKSFTGLKLAIRWITPEIESKPIIDNSDPCGFAYENEINLIFKELISDATNEIVSDEMVISIRDMILQHANVTMQELSDNFMENIIEGYSIESQLDQIREILRRVKNGLDL